MQVLIASVPVPDSVPADPQSRAEWFLDEFGDELGVDDTGMDTMVRDIVEGEPGSAEDGDAVVTFDRVEDGVPVFGGEVKVEVSGDGEVTAAISRIPEDVDDVARTPDIDEADARTTAVEAHPGATVESVSLVILNEGFFTGETSASRLVYRVVMSDPPIFAPIRFIDAITGELLSFSDTNLIDARNRLNPNKLEVVHTLSREKDIEPSGHLRKGRVDEALIRKHIPDPSAVEVFACGDCERGCRVARDRQEACARRELWFALAVLTPRAGCAHSSSGTMISMVTPESPSAAAPSSARIASGPS